MNPCLLPDHSAQHCCFAQVLAYLVGLTPVPPPAGPPGCKCMEKTRASGYKTGFDCPHCRPNGGYPV